MTIILGIDPGSRKTGYGIIHSNGLNHQYLTCGVIQTQEKQLAKKLKTIFSELSNIIQKHQPTTVGIEQVFMAKNANSALKLGQARGVAIAACALSDLEVGEYSARQIKQAVVGYGAAVKEQVQQMVKLLLRLSSVPAVDAADALAVAICHAQTSLRCVV